jgi:enoyl-CoA hydratase/carnithine racemase
MSEVVLDEQRAEVRWISINRPERRNALNRAVADGLIAALDAAEADSGCRAIVLTGAGSEAFCAGGDLQRTGSGSPFDVDPADPRNFVARLLRRMEACNLPIIARVNGHALAGAMGLLCACDLAVASSAARFGTPEIKIGLFPMMILPHLLRVIPLRKLLEMCMTGEPISADEALAIGLVNYVVPPDQLDDKLAWLIGRVTGNSPAALRLGKMGFHALRDLSIDEGVEYAQLMIALMSRTQDSAEGAAAFLEKRKPKWTGR